MVVFTVRMDAARRTSIITRNVREAIAGLPMRELASAADTDQGSLTARLERNELNVADLIGVGGFSRIDPNEFLKGATA